MKPGDGTRIATLLFLGLNIWLGTRELTPPPAGAGAGDSRAFSVERALADVQSLAARPHPIGSAEHDRVRQWLLGRIRELGLEPEVQSATVHRGGSRYASVQNLVARLPGRRGGGQALLLCAHYDSVAGSPGAADDAAGVAALLEVLRVLRAAAPLPNDIILLISDGEEAGLLGARAFVRDHPYAGKVGVVLNLEARGHRGPSILFETSAGNEHLVPVLAQLEDPVTSSLTYEIYRRLPNDTDLTVFKHAGLAGLNLAFIGGLSHYHSARDTPENLDPRSLEHQGQALLTLTRALGGLDLEQLSGSRDRIYFSVLRSWVVQYPTALAWPLTGLAVLLLTLVLRAGFRRRRIDARALRVGVLITLGSTLVSVSVAWLLTWLLARRAALDPLALAIQTDGSAPIMGGLLCLSLTVALLTLARFRVRSSREALWAGALLVWCVLDLPLTALLPGGSYLLTWPLLCGSLGLLALMLRRHRQRPGPGLLAGCGLAVLPGLWLFVPLIWLLFQALTIRNAPVVVGLLGLLLGLLSPLMILLVPAGRRAVPRLLALAGCALIAGSIFTTDPDVHRLPGRSVFYALDHDRGEAIFGTFDRSIDERTAPLLSNARRGPVREFLPGDDRELLQVAAPALDLPGLELELLELEEPRQQPGFRRLTLRCQAPPGARTLAIRLENPTSALFPTPVKLLRVNELVVFDTEGEEPLFPTEPEQRPFSFEYFALPPEGIEITIAVQGEQPVMFQSLLSCDGLPRQGGRSGVERDPTPLLRPHSRDMTFVKQSFTF